MPDKSKPMKYSISIENELRIIRYKHSGLINDEEIGAAWEDLLNIQEFTQKKYNLLSDYRGGEFQMPIEYLSKILEFMRTIEHIVRRKKQALIVDNPYSVATSMLFEGSVYKEVGFIVKVFSTESAALEWLSI